MCNDKTTEYVMVDNSVCHGIMDECVMIGQQGMNWCDNNVCHGVMIDSIMIGQQSM